MIKLLGVQIANGFSSEARVFANLLSERGEYYDALVMMQNTNHEADAFREYSHADVRPIETGWRYSSVERSTYAKFVQLLKFYRSMPELLKIARAYNPDVIYSCQQHWDVRAASYLAYRLRKPQVIHLHYVVGEWLRKHPLSRLKTCDHVITVSNFIRDLAIQYGVRPERVTALLNTMRLPEYDPNHAARKAFRLQYKLPDNAQVIGNVSRLARSKGQSDLIAAFDKAAQTRPNIYLMIVGDGDIKQELQDQAARTSTADRIIFTGLLSDVQSALDGFDLFAHPSHFEPCALALLEASASALPVVAYAEGGTPELIKHGETGLLATSNDVDELAAALEKLLDNPQLAKAMGLAGRKRVAERFSIQQAVSEFTATLEQVAKGMPEYESVNALPALG